MVRARYEQEQPAVEESAAVTAVALNNIFDSIVEALSQTHPLTPAQQQALARLRADVLTKAGA